MNIRVKGKFKDFTSLGLLFGDRLRFLTDADPMCFINIYAVLKHQGKTCEVV